jgi:hypothetical protein
MVQRFEPASARWSLVEETVGSQAGTSSASVAPGSLYRVRACADVMIESTCAESTAFWAPLVPQSAEEIPEIVVTPSGRIFQVSKTLPLESQIEQYNVYQLAVELEGAAPEQLPQMTPPAKPWGAKDFTAADNLARNVYEEYAQYRKPRPAHVPDPSAPKELISDVPPEEWNRFRARRLEGWPEESAITFEPAVLRHTITVFADVTCEHCVQIAKDLDELNKRGIRVRFLAYPLAGPNTPVGRRMEDIWCASDPKSAFKSAMLNEPIAPAHCSKPIVPFHYALARQLGLPGSPAILNERGELIGGYLPPDELQRALERP